MSNRSDSRVCKDADEAVLSYAEVKALCAGDPRIKERMTLEVEVQKLKMLKSSHQSQIYRLQNDVRQTFPQKIKSLTSNISAYQTDIATLEKHPMTPQSEGTALFSPMVVDGVTYTTRKEAGAALLEAAKTVPAGSHSAYTVGEWRGMEVRIIRPMLNAPPNIEVKGAQVYSCEMSADPAGNITRMVNRLEKLPSYLEADQANLANTQQQLEQAKALQFEPFPQEQELTEKLTRLAELTQALNLDNKKKQAQQDEQAPEKKSESVADRPKRLSDRLREDRAAIARSNPVQQSNSLRRMAVEH